MADGATRETYYLKATDDEYNPAQGDLPTLAAIVAKGIAVDGMAVCGDEDEDDILLAPATDGQAFHAYSIVWHYVPVRRGDDAVYRLPDDLPGEPHAWAFGPGMGWNGDDLIYAEDGQTQRAAAEAAIGLYGTDPVEWLVCRGAEWGGTLVFSAGDPPRMVKMEPTP